MKTLKRLDLTNVMGGQAAQAPLAVRQGQATLDYNNCLGLAGAKANAATTAAGQRVMTGQLTPQAGIAAGVEANRTQRSDVAACDAKYPIPTE
jgi:hypothetical protein